MSKLTGRFIQIFVVLSENLNFTGLNWIQIQTICNLRDLVDCFKISIQFQCRTRSDIPNQILIISSFTLILVINRAKSSLRKSNSYIANISRDISKLFDLIWQKNWKISCQMVGSWNMRPYSFGYIVFFGKDFSWIQYFQTWSSYFFS